MDNREDKSNNIDWLLYYIRKLKEIHNILPNNVPIKEELINIICLIELIRRIEEIIAEIQTKLIDEMNRWSWKNYKINQDLIIQKVLK